MPTSKLTRYELEELLRDGRAMVAAFLERNPPDGESVTAWARAVRSAVLQEPLVEGELRRRVEEHTRLLIVPDLGPSARPAYDHAERLNRLLDRARYDLELAPTKISHATFAQVARWVADEQRSPLAIRRMEGRGVDIKDLRRCFARLVDLQLASSVADDPDRIEPAFGALREWLQNLA